VSEFSSSPQARGERGGGDGDPDGPGPVRLDAGRSARARLGFVLLAMDQLCEADMVRAMPPGVSAHFARTPMSNVVTAATLADMRDGIAPAAARILPAARLDVVCLACTSGGVVIGEEAVVAALERGAPGARATTLVTGVTRALDALGVRRIVAATPYVEEINRLEADHLERRGFEVLSIRGMQIVQDVEMARVTPDYIAEFAAALDRPDADAVFVSCSALRSMEVVEQLEARLGKPVVVSNQAMLWDCLRLAGIDDRLPGLGRLLRKC